MLIVRTPVRISFAGGGTDLPTFYEQYGGAVLSTAINKYFYTVLTERDDNKIQVVSADFKETKDLDNLDIIEDIAQEDLAIPIAVIKFIGLKRGINLFLASEIPPGTGLGSSASVCVNLLKSLATLNRTAMSRYDLAEAAFSIATKVLGKPVGKQDEYAAAFGGINLFCFLKDGVQVKALELDSETLQGLEEGLLLFFTGSARSSWEILKEQKEASAKGERQVIGSLMAMRDQVARMEEVLLAGDLEAFGLLLNEGWQLKKQLSGKISNPRIDALYELAREKGALGGKITGAGGGGFLMLYCGVEKQEAVKKALAEAGLKELSFRFDFHGARVILDDPFFDSRGRGGTSWKFLSFD